MNKYFAILYYSYVKDYWVIISTVNSGPCTDGSDKCQDLKEEEIEVDGPWEDRSVIPGIGHLFR